MRIMMKKPHNQIHKQNKRRCRMDARHGKRIPVRSSVQTQLHKLSVFHFGQKCFIRGRGEIHHMSSAGSFRNAVKRIIAGKGKRVRLISVCQVRTKKI